MTRTTLEVIHYKDELKMNLLLHRCKKATLFMARFFGIRLGSVDDDGDARNGFVTMGRQSIAPDPDKPEELC